MNEKHKKITLYQLSDKKGILPNLDRKSGLYTKKELKNAIETLEPNDKWKVKKLIITKK